MRTNTSKHGGARVLSLVLTAASANAPHAMAGDYALPLVTTNGVYGPLLAAERNGRTLYVRDDANGGAARCDDRCAVRRPPYGVSPLDFPTDGLGIVHRADGTRQWTLEGRPLHFFGADRRTGDALGDGRHGWRALRPVGIERTIGAATPHGPFVSHE